MPPASPAIGARYFQAVSNAPIVTPTYWVKSRSLLAFHQSLNSLQLFARI
jgi:hypothetical protein